MSTGNTGEPAVHRARDWNRNGNRHRIRAWDHEPCAGRR